MAHRETADFITLVKILIDPALTETARLKYDSFEEERGGGGGGGGAGGPSYPLPR